MALTLPGIIAALARYYGRTYPVDDTLAEFEAEVSADLARLDHGDLSRLELHRMLREHRNRLLLEQVQVKSIRWWASAILQLMAAHEAYEHGTGSDYWRGLIDMMRDMVSEQGADKEG